MAQPSDQYDAAILEHYRKEAQAQGLAETSTMADLRTRELETMFILNAIRAITASRQNPLICDAGCGNGYTLGEIRKAFAGARLAGLEYTPELRRLATERFAGDAGVTINPCDIRQPLPLAQPADILISQRVVINLLVAAHQAAAIENLTDAIRVGGHLVIIEAFGANLRYLNEARGEFGLEPIGEAYHNLYLADDFFDQFTRLERVHLPGANENFLSTHYFVTRVLHAAAFSGKAFVRNSHFVRFLSEALAPAGAYSPLRGFTFKRVR